MNSFTLWISFLYLCLKNQNKFERYLKSPLNSQWKKNNFGVLGFKEYLLYEILTENKILI